MVRPVSLGSNSRLCVDARILAFGQGFHAAVAISENLCVSDNPALGAPYAAFGAFYFLISAIWLTVKNVRQRSALVD